MMVVMVIAETDGITMMTAMNIGETDGTTMMTAMNIGEMCVCQYQPLLRL